MAAKSTNIYNFKGISMYPTIKNGDVILAEPVKSIDDISVGDVVAFSNSTYTDSVIVHRVIKRKQESVVTCGDNTLRKDSPDIDEKFLKAKVNYIISGSRRKRVIGGFAGLILFKILFFRRVYRFIMKKDY